MHSQGHFKRNAQSLLLWIVHRISAEIIDYPAAGVYIVGIVILTFTGTVNRIGKARPLCGVACPFQVAGQAAGFSTAQYVSHSSAKTDSIGAYHSFLSTLIT